MIWLLIFISCHFNPFAYGYSSFEYMVLFLREAW